MTQSAEHYFAHSSACIDDGAEIGENCKIWHYSHIMAGAVIGGNTTIGQNVLVSAGCTVGNNVKIQNNVSVYTGVTLEDDVFCGPSMVFTNVINPRAFIERKHEFRSSLVKRGASIGANATIICGCTLGAYCMIGAGAVITRDVPAYGLVIGNPGRLTGFVCQCGEKLMNTDQTADTVSRQDIVCKACRKRYRKTGLELSIID